MRTAAAGLALALALAGVAGVLVCPYLSGLERVRDAEVAHNHVADNLLRELPYTGIVLVSGREGAFRNRFYLGTTLMTAADEPNAKYDRHDDSNHDSPFVFLTTGSRASLG